MAPDVDKFASINTLRRVQNILEGSSFRFGVSGFLIPILLGIRKVWHLSEMYGSQKFESNLSQSEQR